MQGASSMLPSPMRAGTSSSAASTSAAAAAAAAAAGMAPPDDCALLDRLAEDLTSTLDRKAETEQALMEDLLASLRREKQKLEADAWRYAAKRSQLNLTS
ncbi:hypothetical protein BDL97_02G039700 [Sphagnum fallax]|nr:hypothetical protein BDL97_02G039700 [Sphagnum fallax]